MSSLSRIQKVGNRRSSSNEKKERQNSKSKDNLKSEKKRSKSKAKNDEKIKEKLKLSEKSLKKEGKIKVSKVVDAEKSAKILKPSPVVEYQYEDDFEEYDDDFEEDSSVDDANSPSLKYGAEVSFRNKQQVDSSSTSDPKISDVILKPKKFQSVVAKSPINDDVDSSNNPFQLQQSSTLPVSRLLNRMEARQKIGGGHVAAPTTKSSLNQRNDAFPARTSRPINIDFTNARHFDHTTTSVDYFRGIIRMEYIGHKLAELAPMNAYDYYMQLFGKGGRVQVSIQTFEDAITNETQTESEEKKQIWTQCPPSDAAGLGWGRVFEVKSAYKTEYFTEESVDLHFLPKINDERFKLFVYASCGLISDIIRDNDKRQSNFYLSNKSKLAFSAGYETLTLQQPSCKNKVTAITVRDDAVAQDRIVVSYYIESFSLSFFINRSVILEYSLVPDTTPFFCFVADNQVTAVTYGPDNSKILCAGLMDGSCVFYDTTEAESSHRDRRFPWEGTEGLLARVPSYDASFHSTTSGFGKNAALVCIVVISTGQVDSFQLVTMNNRGTILLYTILENMQMGIDPETVSNFGVRPGAKIKVSNPSEITNSMPLFKEHSFAANYMVINPSNKYQLLIAVNQGIIVNLTRLNEEYTCPRRYNCGNDRGVETCSLRFSHFDSNVFMSGLSNGNVCIFRITQGDPVLTLYPPNRCKLAVTHVEWSPTFHNILYSIHGGEKILVWDISTSKSAKHICDIYGEFGSRIISTTVWRPHQNIGMMALGMDDGTLQMHALDRVGNSSDKLLSEILDGFQCEI